MENLNGALGFKATLDIDNFSVSAQAMENQIRRVSASTQGEAADMENSLLQFAQRGAAYLTTYLVGQGFAGVLQSIATTRGQFQQLEIAFETMLGSGTKAQALMNQMVETAAKTPFDLMGVAGGAKQLMAYGLAADKVNDTLIKLGNIASGLSIPLNDIVYLYGTTMVQGRLYTQDVRQFTGRGIPLVRELAEMYGVTADKINEMVTAGKIGFADVEKVLNKLTGTGGQFYNLMAKQSASLTGMISNLEDAWDSMLNEIGKQNQDLFAGAIGMASTLVENYDEIIRILKAVAIGYGSVKAGIVANTLVTKHYTGVALIDNTVRAAKIALMKAEAAMTGKTKAQTELMTKADEAHVAALQAELTAEEHANLVKQLRISTIASLLTAQQQEYLSNLGLTTSSEGYEAAALGVLSVEQQEALRKTDLSSKSAIYKAALEQEVMTKKANRAATLEAMRADVSAAAASLENAKKRAIASTAAVEQARLDVYWAKASGNATAIAAAEKRLEVAVEQQSATRKAALAAQSEFLAKKKALEAAATRQSTVASVADTTAKEAQSTATSILSAVTTKATLAIKTLWATMKSNPLGWILSLIGLVVSAITMFTGKTKEAKTAQGEFQESTRKQTEELDTMMAILEHTTEGTSSHKKAIEKINALCKEYNVTLLEENSTLEDQRKKYNELTKAIKENTAEKIKAKYTEQTAQDRSERDSEALENLKNQTGKFKNYHISEYGGEGYWYSVKEIQGASDALFEMIEADAKQAADTLRTLTGEEYTKTYNELFNGMSKAFQAATGAADNDMNNYKNTLQKYFDEIVESAKTESKDLQNELSQINQYLKKDGKVSVVVETDYTTLSFSDLDTKIKNTQKQIDELNKKTVKVETDNTDLKELQELIKKLTGAKAKKQDNLNTESDISARIKELKDERSNVEINSEKYKSLTKDIEALSKKLPKNGDKGTDSQNALNQKQLEAERAVEEARISVMEEGYEKRKAIATLEHRRNLDRINKEEQELIEARKKAGQGGLSKEEKDGFEARRTAENQSFDKTQQSLFNGEIDYKKKQYELYFQWVQNVGKDVADKHFSDLLQSGKSFTSWINSQIADLENKRTSSPETFTEGDANALNQLKAEKDEMAGVKSSMDLFRESVQQTLNQASTLAEKLQAVTDLKEKLASGGFNLNEDETVQAAYSLEEQDVQYQRELQNMVIEDFKSYEEKKTSIMAQYAALRLTEQAQNNEALLERINRGEAEALSELEVAQLQASTDWKNLFQNLDSLTAEEIQRLINSIEKAMAEENLNLSPVDYQALIDSLNKAKEKVVEINPFNALGTAFDKYIESCKKLKRAEKENLSAEEIRVLKKETQTNAKLITASLKNIGQAVGSVGNSMSSLASSFGNDGLADAIGSVTGALEGAGQTAMGVGQIMSGDLLGGITSVISGITSVISIFSKMHDAKKEKQIKRLQVQIDQLADSYDDLGYAIDRAYSKDKASLLEQQNENLKKQNELIRQQIQYEEAKKKTDRERIKDWEDQIKENEREIEENEKYRIIEAITGTDVKTAIDDFATAYADAWAKGENAAKRSAETVKNIIKNSIIETLRNKLQPEVEEFMTYLKDALEDEIISESEEAMLDEYQRRMDKIQQEYLRQTGKWLEDDSQEDSLSGAVRNMSEETGGLVAGRLNAVVINQSQQHSVLREQLAYQAQIAQNTADSAKDLREIKMHLQGIKNQESVLLSQGIS